MHRLLSFLPLLLVGCGDCQEVHLTPEERAWFADYRPGATLTFRSNRGGSATFTVLPRQEWYENTNCNKLESGPYQPIFSQLVLRPAVSYSAQFRDFVLNIRKTNPERAGLLTFSAAGLDGTTDALLGKPTATLRQQACTLSSGQSYPAAYVFRQGQNATAYGNSRVRAFYWDKAAGLIRYELADGEIFDLAPR
ncbi:hypothetical protein LJ737_24970 [Hymenobacter sp. 15J16-1T3B]|uniref:hypothetical protein n=1 Tax=Hymenobacter sp. 15J16-1T3B TaxID=2886941 RepID=UPI001D0FE8DC|nr:hypothetical protein [Hymenobacter sp. 15J16-1T3B]MCC3160513.1 hypothetical protein [Hymenobacter sp. 15J16-1T3B]